MKLTLLNAVLLGTLEVLILLLLHDTLNALIVVVLVGGALGGVGTFCRAIGQSRISWQELRRFEGNCDAIGALMRIAITGTRSVRMLNKHSTNNPRQIIAEKWKGVWRRGKDLGDTHPPRAWA
jgi:TRAP-type mannitol/chloroaromatic compound transport system permease large subunit